MLKLSNLTINKIHIHFDDKKQEVMVESCQSTILSAAERRQEAEARMGQKVKDKLQETEIKLHNANGIFQLYVW